MLGWVCREGINTAVAEVTSLGVTSTAMFFPDKRRYNRQMKMYRKQCGSVAACMETFADLWPPLTLCMQLWKTAVAVWHATVPYCCFDMQVGL